MLILSSSHSNLDLHSTRRRTHLYRHYQLPLQPTRRTRGEDINDQFAYFSKDTADGRKEGAEHFECLVAREHTRRIGGGDHQPMALQISIPVCNSRAFSPAGCGDPHENMVVG